MMDWLRRLFKIHSPSKEFDRILRYEKRDEYKIFRGLKRRDENDR